MYLIAWEKPRGATNSWGNPGVQLIAGGRNPGVHLIAGRNPRGVPNSWGNPDVHLIV